MKVTIRFKGGKGSGNYGHAGRPGEIGGSANNSYVDYVSLAADIGNKGAYFVDHDGKLVDMHGKEHSVYIGAMMRNHPDIAQSYFGMTAEHVNDAKTNFDDPYNWVHDVVKNNFVRIRFDKSELNIQTKVIDKETYNKLQKYVDDGKIPYVGRIVWEGFDIDRSNSRLANIPSSERYVVQTTSDKFMFGTNLRYDANDAVITVKENIVNKQLCVILRLKGGEGSGNADHAGRPGEVGGSQPTGTAATSQYVKKNGADNITIYKVSKDAELPKDLQYTLNKISDKEVKIMYNSASKNWHVPAGYIPHVRYTNDALDGEKPVQLGDATQFDAYPETIIARGTYNIKTNTLTLYDLRSEAKYMLNGEPFEIAKLKNLMRVTVSQAKYSLFTVNGKTPTVNIITADQIVDKEHGTWHMA